MVMIGNDTYEDLTVTRFEEIIDAFDAGAGAGIRPGPQIERVFSAAEGGATTLRQAPTKTRERFVPPPPPPPPAATDAPADAVPAAPAAAQAPTAPGKKRLVTEEAAPGLKGPAGAAKLPVASTEAERKQAQGGATGESNKAMRPDATGSESPAGKVDGGKKPGRGKR